MTRLQKKFALAIGVVLALIWLFFLWVWTDAATAMRRPETNYQKASRIVRAVFPAATEDAALRIVGCETGYTYEPWATNRSSGASGWFQFIPGNFGRVLYGPPSWSSRLASGRANPDRFVIPGRPWILLPWTNTRAAWYLSRAGSDFGEWTCSP